MKNNVWLTSLPLKGHSTLNEISFLRLASIPWPSVKFFVHCNFNIHTPFQPDPRATLSISSRKGTEAPFEAPGLSFYPMQRWSIDLRNYSSFENFLNDMKRWHRCNYNKSKSKFNEFNGTVSYITGDWSEHAEKAYEIYKNVASRHQEQIYDLNFFRIAAKNPNYKLLCAWIEGKMIGVFVLVEELPTLHSILCGLDYTYSKNSYAYSWMHYELIRFAIESKKYENVDIGLSADKAKEQIGFNPTAFYLDFYGHTPLSRFVLKVLSTFMTPEITPEGIVKLTFKFWKK